MQHKRSTGGSIISCLMLARQDGIFTKVKGTTSTRRDVQAEEKKNHSRVSDYDIRQDQDQFPEKSLLDPADLDQKGDVLLAV